MTSNDQKRSGKRKEITTVVNKYILFDGLTYNTRGYPACELRSIFPDPKGTRKNTSNEQNVLAYYMLSHRMRDLLFHL